MNATTPGSHHPLLAQFAMIPACQRSNGEADWFPPVDILEDSEEYLFKIDLPEVRPENIRVVVERDGLFISGQRPNPWGEDKSCLRIERPHGYFERRFALPEDASRVEISSAFQEGVLELRVRKLGATSPNPVATEDRPKLRLRSAT